MTAGMKARSTRPGFTARVFLVLFSAMLTLFVVCNLMFFKVHRRYHETKTVSAGQSLCRLLAEEARDAIAEGRLRKLAAVVRMLMPLEGINRVRVISPQGKIIFQINREGSAPLAEKADRAAVPIGLAGARDPVYSGADGYLRFWFPVRSGPDTQEAGRAMAYVSVDLDHSAGDREIREFIVGGITVALLIIIISGFMTLVIVRSAVSPLKRFLDMARTSLPDSAAAGEEESVPDHDYNELISRVETLFNNLGELNRTLEEEASARNRELREAHIQMRQAMHELKEIQAQVIQAEKMAALGLLVSGVAHEINNTMNIISGALPPLAMQMEKLREQADEAGREKIFANLETLMGNIREGAARTSEIVRNLQDFSRSRPMEYKNADPCRILDTTLFLMRPRMKGRIEIIREYGSNGATLPCYPGQLGQVFMNIILNSVQAIEGRGRLLVRTEVKDGRFLIAIADDGPGIAPEIRERVFDPFFTTKGTGHGTGLGLSVSYAIIKGHRGEIRINPSPFGQGCEFLIALPMDRKQKREQETRAMKLIS